MTLTTKERKQRKQKDRLSWLEMFGGADFMIRNPGVKLNKKERKIVRKGMLRGE